jgi:hypothetical protein
MPLSKTIEVNNTGVNATYWVPVIGTVDRASGTTWFVMRGYVSKAVYDAGIGNHVDERPYTAPIDAGIALPVPNGDLFANVLAYLETLALQQDDFVDAEQVA